MGLEWRENTEGDDTLIRKTVVGRLPAPRENVVWKR